MILDNTTTLPRTVKSGNTTSAGATIITATTHGKAIHLVDLINGDGSNMASIKDRAAGGPLVAQVPAGGTVSLSAPIKVSHLEATVNNGSGYSVGNGLTVTVDSLPKALLSGDVLYFSGGGVLTLTSGANAGATSLAGNLTVADLTDNEKGKTKVAIHVATATKFTATYIEEG